MTGEASRRHLAVKGTSGSRMERRALLEFALHFDLAAMFLNYSVDD
jgi:hypothetical protein